MAQKTRICRPESAYFGKQTDFALAVATVNETAKIYADDFANLACNAVKINGLPAHIPHDFIMQTLIAHGSIGRTRFTEDFYAPSSAGTPNIYGYPTRYVFVPVAGTRIYVNADDAIILKANPLGTPVYPIIYRAARTMAQIDRAIDNNLIATQSTQILEVENDDTAASVRAAFENRVAGVPAVVVRKDIGESLKSTANNNPYIADKLFQLRAAIRDEILQHLGILTANRDKKERVQSAEVSASVGEVVDYIYTLIDTFNRDAERYGVPYRAELNSSVEEFYADEPEPPEKINDTENDENG